MLEFLKDAVEDLATLEVATLTNKSDKALPLAPKLEGDSKTQHNNAEKAVSDARANLLAKISANAKKPDIKTAKNTLKEAENQLADVEKALGIYDPKDIFSKIRSGLSEAKLVAYSRFELEGDSMNFINNDESVKDLTDRHKEMVASSQEARKALFSAVKDLFPGGN